MDLTTSLTNNSIPTPDPISLAEMLLVAAAYLARSLEIYSTGTVLKMKLSDGGIATIYVPLEKLELSLLNKDSQFNFFKFGLAVVAAEIENLAIIAQPAESGTPGSITAAVQTLDKNVLINTAMVAWIAEAEKKGFDMSSVLAFPFAILFTKSWIEYLLGLYGVNS